ncbi:pseudouridylate synthase 7 homolog isoform X2 [Mya arenaria]|nr:pseudouridylate synthase 7 homolog isoform X2 [Mya arenaria]
MEHDDGDVSCAKRQRLENSKDTDRCTDKEDIQEENSADNAYSTGPVREDDVGITEYISTLPGFSGILKQRYSDFLVNEISLDGEVVRLTNTDLPCPLPQATPQVETGSLALVSREDADKLTELLQSKDTSRCVTIQASTDKGERTRMHAEISRCFPGLETDTVVDGDNRLIQARITTNKGNARHNWPKGRGDYCRFVLYKENKDTMDAVGLIAKMISLKSSLFQYCGTKDRRGKTSQHISVYKVAPEKLRGLNKKLRNIVLGNFSYVEKPLQLSGAQGSKFTVVLRSVTGSQDQIDAGMTSLRETGFINYFGMQRFGTSAIPSHHIGRALLLGDFKTAVELILKPRPGDTQDEQLTAARQFWWEKRDSKAAINKFPKFSYIERNILSGLVGNENNFLGAFQKLSRNNRLMYVHAYQSYIWNVSTSHRVKKYGLKPMVGDLVIPGVGDYRQEEDTDEQASEDSDSKPKPVIVTAENIAEYSIYDVVLPTPGHFSVYPDNDIKSLYKELMEKDGLDYTDMKRKQKDFSLPGTYRHILVKPKDVSWQLHHYDDPNIPLVLSDWDIIKEEKLPENTNEGSKLALEVTFSLPPSCYATMALRDLLKIDTSAGYHTSLTNAT